MNQTFRSLKAVIWSVLNTSTGTDGSWRGFPKLLYFWFVKNTRRGSITVLRCPQAMGTPLRVSKHSWLKGMPKLRCWRAKRQHLSKSWSQVMQRPYFKSKLLDNNFRSYLTFKIVVRLILLAPPLIVYCLHDRISLKRRSQFSCVLRMRRQHWQINWIRGLRNWRVLNSLSKAKCWTCRRRSTRVQRCSFSGKQLARQLWTIS